MHQTAAEEGVTPAYGVTGREGHGHKVSAPLLGHRPLGYDGSKGSLMVRG